METYKVVRFYKNFDNKILKMGLFLEEAQHHCMDPETSSATCTTEEGRRETETHGPWFDGYLREES